MDIANAVDSGSETAMVLKPPGPAKKSGLYTLGHCIATGGRLECAVSAEVNRPTA